MNLMLLEELVFLISTPPLLLQFNSVDVTVTVTATITFWFLKSVNAVPNIPQGLCNSLIAGTTISNEWYFRPSYTRLSPKMGWLTIIITISIPILILNEDSRDVRYGNERIKVPAESARGPRNQGVKKEKKWWKIHSSGSRSTASRTMWGHRSGPISFHPTLFGRRL